MFYIFFPTEAESRPFLELMGGSAKSGLARRAAYTGSMAGSELSVVICGIGQANAAQTLTSVMESAQAGVVLLGGCAGAYPGSGLSVGDVAVASRETYADLGVDAPGGFVSMEGAGLMLMDNNGGVYDTVTLGSAAMLGLELFGGLGFGVKFGGFLTVSTVTGTTRRGEELFGRYGALCENMEGAAAAQIAKLYDTPFLEIRGISNMAVDRDRESWDIPLAAKNCAAAIKRVIESWR